jgi:hypothetical protein
VPDRSRKEHSRANATFSSRLISGLEYAEGDESGFAQFGKNFCVEIRSDPESRSLYQFIEHWLGQIDQAGPLRSDHNAEEIDHC